MTTLKVEGMHCDMCVKRITNALNGAGIEHAVSLENKTVTLQDDGKTQEAIGILDDLGFDAVR